MTFDKETRTGLFNLISKIMMERKEIYEEEWVTAQELCKRLPMFTLDFLKHFGNKLPRKRTKVVDEDGELIQRAGKAMYPLHKIMRMIDDGELDTITVVAKAREKETA